MKKQWQLLLAACLLIMVVYVWFGFLDEEDEAEPVTVDSGLSAAQQEQAHEALAELRQAKKEKDEEGTLSATLKFAQAIGGKAGGMLSMAASRILPVHFWGRVIDQHGVGVANARVDLVISGGGSFATSTGSTYVLTDSQGYFEVKGKGQDVSILDVKHKNVADVYYRSRGGKKAYGNKDLRATNQHGEEYNWYSYEKKESPLIIDVWRVEKFEKVKGGYGGFHPTPDGQPSKRSTRLGMIATCLREPKDAGVPWQDQKGSWSITLRPINGGIQETEDLYLNEAPEGGYQPEVTVSMQRGSPDYQVRIYPARHYYYHYLDDGKRVYGSLEAVFEPFSFDDDECRINVNYKYSPSGSRNLAMRKRR